MLYVSDTNPMSASSVDSSQHAFRSSRTLNATAVRHYILEFWSEFGIGGGVQTGMKLMRDWV